MGVNRDSCRELRRLETLLSRFAFLWINVDRAHGRGEAGMAYRNKPYLPDNPVGIVECKGNNGFPNRIPARGAFILVLP